MKHFKKFLALLVPLIVFCINGNTQNTGFSRSAFYAAMSGNDIPAINSQLAIVRAVTIHDKDAYEGALLMKKAGLVGKAKEKLSLFKAGRSKLEGSIKKDKDNAEYSFLRLIIQEHAPRIVEYRGNIESDISIIRSNYKKLPLEVQQAIIDYSRRSKMLKLP
jgi:hypothetical protein